MSNASNSVTFADGYGQLNPGYILYKGQRSIFYPMLGIGGVGYSLPARQKNPGGSFDNQIQAPPATPPEDLRQVHPPSRKATEESAPGKGWANACDQSEIKGCEGDEHLHDFGFLEKPITRCDNNRYA